VGTRNILAITTTVQCVAAQDVRRIKDELLPLYPQVDDVVFGLGFSCS
jgi:galactarate dehydratase